MLKQKACKASSLIVDADRKRRNKKSMIANK
jgi:hypothetical protein